MEIKLSGFDIRKRTLTPGCARLQAFCWCLFCRCTIDHAGPGKALCDDCVDFLEWAGVGGLAGEIKTHSGWERPNA